MIKLECPRVKMSSISFSNQPGSLREKTLIGTTSWPLTKMSMTTCCSSTKPRVNCPIDASWPRISMTSPTTCRMKAPRWRACLCPQLAQTSLCRSPNQALPSSTFKPSPASSNACPPRWAKWAPETNPTNKVWTIGSPGASSRGMVLSTLSQTHLWECRCTWTKIEVEGTSASSWTRYRLISKAVTQHNTIWRIQRPRSKTLIRTSGPTRWKDRMSW